ncbi:GNAT family N-acetyltransferase [Ewingella sp. S1.OA.A_B6]
MLIIAPLDPFTTSFDSLLEESKLEGQRMLVRLLDNWHSGMNRFALPGEMLNGVFSLDSDHQRRLVAIGGRNIDPYINQLRAGRIRHLYVTHALRRQGVGQLLMTHLIDGASLYFDYLNTHAPQSAYAFYQNLGFEPVNGDENVTHRLIF